MFYLFFFFTSLILWKKICLAGSHFIYGTKKICVNNAGRTEKIDMNQASHCRINLWKNGKYFSFLFGVIMTGKMNAFLGLKGITNDKTLSVFKLFFSFNLLQIN